MKKGIIITLPDYDDTTEYLSKWSFEILDEARNKSVKIKKLRGKEVNRKDFEKVVSKLDYRMLIFNGHGSESSIFGYKEEIIIEENDNDEILKERITYARSCESASSLGIKSMKNTDEGCFLGYNLPFTFYIDYKWNANPRKDNVAGLFLSSSNLIPISLIKGNSANEAHGKSKKQMLKNIKKILRNKTMDSFLIAEALWNNYTSQTIIGNKEAKL
ncbi:MAG: hypothetical protein IIA87_05005 [Nanoarchaeota archaeon]|nr:hypothetical protein [Nanoarchaeota archaeon]